MAYRDSSTRNTSASANALGTKPATLTVGDYMAAILVWDGNTAVNTPPSGWNSRGGGFQAGPDGQTILLYDKDSADASDVAASTFTWACAASVSSIIQIVALSGRNTAAPRTFVATPAANTTSNTSPITVTLSSGTAVAGDDVIWMAALDQTIQTATWGMGTNQPSGYTKRQDASNSDWASATCSTLDNSAGGALGNLTGTYTRSAGTGNAGWRGFVLSIAAASASVQRKNNLLRLGVGR